MELAELVRQTRSLEDLPALLARLGHEPLWDPVAGQSDPAVVVGRAGDFPWYALTAADADRRARAFARRMAVRGRLCGVIGLDPAGRRLTFAVSLSGAPRLSVDLDAPEATAVARWVGSRPRGWPVRPAMPRT